MILDAEKQLIKIIKRVKFIKVNTLWLFIEIIILDLAIIIKAAIRILKIIRVDDIESVIENIVIEEVDETLVVRNRIDMAVISIIDEIIIHQ